MGRRQNDSARRPDVRPLDVDGVRTVAIVTVGWGVAFVVLALRQGQLNDAGRGWWLWTSLAGVGLGLLGLEYCRRRRDAIAQAALEAEAGVDEFDDDRIGDWSRLPPEEELDGADDHPHADEPATGDHTTQPYRPAGQQPGYPTGDMPVGPSRPAPPSSGQAGPPAHAQGRHSYPESQSAPAAPQHAEPRPSEPPAPPRYREPAPQQPVERPRQEPTRPSAPQQQPSMPPGGVPARHAAQRPAPPPQPAQPPARPAPTPPPQSRPQPRPSPPRQPPSREPEAPPPDPYSTGAGWYDSAAGYSPDADRARAHPRDRRPQAPRASGPSAESPSTGPERPRRRRLEDSEFFGDDSSAPPPNSTAEFLLADLEDDDEPPPPASHDRDAPGDEYGNRRARRSR